MVCGCRERRERDLVDIPEQTYQQVKGEDKHDELRWRQDGKALECSSTDSLERSGKRSEQEPKAVAYHQERVENSVRHCALCTHRYWCLRNGPSDAQLHLSYM
ncbi:hypothetical protein JG688_00014837 [Phytophthora aleatoria]|uniref:Uncharacterized protein n=1 Tax=Phytophthora aleatoria TaxID=2496075 RepID=A0A8J5M034_9STRA|nr:hypothetical protein JG688_00014837 [Phytophthora aleatoria]